jgi:hypothetical protein
MLSRARIPDPLKARHRMRFVMGALYHLRPENAKRVGLIISQAEHLHIVQSTGKDGDILVDAATLTVT